MPNPHTFTGDPDIGLISLNPYVPETENLGQNANSMLISKLQQIATANGMSGA